MLGRIKLPSNSELIFYLTLTLAFFLPLSRAVLSFATIVLPLLWIFNPKIKERLLEIKQNPALLAIGLFLLVQALSILYTQDQSTGWNSLRMYSYWIVLFVIATSIQPKQVPKIITAFLYGMFISEICAYIIFFDIYPINGHTSSYPNPFMHHIIYSVFLAFSAALLLNRLLSEKYTIKEKTFIALFFITITFNLFISTGRTGQLAFLVSIFVTLFIHFKVSMKTLLLSLVVTFSIFYNAYLFIPQVESRVVAGKNDIEKLLNKDFDSSWGIRVAYWLISYEVLKEEPLLGVGVGDYKQAAKEVLLENKYNFSDHVIAFCSKYHFHNQFLMVAVQTGVIGLLLMLYFFSKLMKLKIQDSEMQKLSYIFLSIMLTSFFAESLWLRQNSLLLFLLFCALMIASEKKQNSTLPTGI